MTHLSQNHIVVAVGNFRGHSRPLASIACNLLLIQPRLHVTLLTSPESDEFVRSVVLEHFPAKTGRLRIVAALGSHDPACVFYDMEAARKQRTDRSKGSLIDILVTLFEGKTEAWDRHHSQLVTDLSGIPPSAFLVDLFHLFSCDILASATASAGVAQQIPLYVHSPTPIAHMTPHLVSDGGSGYKHMRPLVDILRSNGTFGADVEDEDIIVSAEYEQLAYPIFKDLNSAIKGGEGVPPMFDYEYLPQMDAVPFPPGLLPVMTFMVDQCLEADGLVFPWTSSVLEPTARRGSLSAVPDLDIFALGAQGTSALWDRAPVVREDRSELDVQILSFLDKSFVSCGEKSLVYISFGSLFYPAFKPQHISILLDVLLDLGIPFLFARASPLAQPLDPELVERIEKSGRGLVVPYAPQHDVLLHSATGWFLTHGGSNSTSESLICDVPTIMWPALADQPGIASQFSDVLGLSFELLQVRNGASIGRPTARGPVVLGTDSAIEEEMRDVFGKLWKEEGEKIRGEVEKMGARMREERQEGGAAWTEMMRLARTGLEHHE